MFRAFLGFVLILGMLSACATQRPIDEMSVADVSLKAAQKAKADVLSAEIYRKAENYFLKARRDYSDGYYDSAKKFANQARLFAEQAEFQAATKQLQAKTKPAAPTAEPSAGTPGGIQVPSPGPTAEPLE